MAWKIESESNEEEFEFVPVNLNHCSHVRTHICEVYVCVCVYLCVRANATACVRVSVSVRERYCMCLAYPHTQQCVGWIDKYADALEYTQPTGSSDAEFDISAQGSRRS